VKNNCLKVSCTMNPQPWPAHPLRRGACQARLGGARFGGARFGGARFGGAFKALSMKLLRQDAGLARDQGPDLNAIKMRFTDGSPHRPEERHHPPLRTARNQARRAAGPALRADLHLWSHLPA